MQAFFPESIIIKIATANPGRGDQRHHQPLRAVLLRCHGTCRVTSVTNRADYDFCYKTSKTLFSKSVNAVLAFVVMASAEPQVAQLGNNMLEI